MAERQAEAMDLYAALGASCGVLVTFRLAPSAAWRRMKELFGRKYLKPEDLAAMGWEISLFDDCALCQACTV